MKDIFKNQKDELLVLIDEEHGFRQWFWFPKMKTEELELWWKSLKSVQPYFFHPKPLPGKVILCKDMDFWNELYHKGIYYLCNLHCDFDSSLVSPTKESIYHAGWTGDISDEEMSKKNI